MLDCPQHGWSHITIGTWSDRCSYLDDVPFMLLHAISGFLSTRQPVSVKFDAEGYEYILVFDFSVVHIIKDADDGYKLSSQEVSYPSLIEELIGDIRREIDGWTGWMSYESEDLRGRKERLLAECGNLESLIQQTGKENS